MQISAYMIHCEESLEKTLILGKIEDWRKKGLQRMRWLDGKCHFEYLCFLLHMHNFRIFSSYIMSFYCVYVCVHGYDYSRVW